MSFKTLLQCFVYLSKFDLILFTGAQPKAGTGHKMQTVSVVFSTLHCEGYTADLRYIAGSLLLWSLKSYPPFWKARGIEDSQEKDYSFLGNDTFPNLYDSLVYEWLFGETNIRAITSEWTFHRETYRE